MVTRSRAKQLGSAFEHQILLTEKRGAPKAIPEARIDLFAPSQEAHQVIESNTTKAEVDRPRMNQSERRSESLLKAKRRREEHEDTYGLEDLLATPSPRKKSITSRCLSAAPL